MRYRLAALLWPICALACAACDPNALLGEGDAGATPTATVDSGASPAAPAASGQGCTDPIAPNLTLCTETSLCPSLAVDHDAYPDCGFRVEGGLIDLECICGTALCPVGSALTCADAKTLLDTQSELAVCTQVAEGRCAPIVGQASAGDAGGAPQSGSCDKMCAGECGGDPTCIQQCGC